MDGKRPTTTVRSILKTTTKGTPASAAKIPKKRQAKTPESEGLLPKTPPGSSGKKRAQQSQLPSGGEKSIGWKVVSEKGRPSKSNPVKEVEPWVHCLFVDFVHEASANTKPKGLIQEFQASLVNVLKVIHEEDPAVCLLHRLNPLLHPIRGVKEFEGKTYREWGLNFRFDRTNYFNTATKERSKKIRGTI